MQDVIFSGTENRKPLSYASVAITLDNSDHQLPVEYEEVTVTRKLYRSGESEYLINGTQCRLKDINEMFYDTGIGKEGYSIIGQGQIDKILSGKPEERRELFDEAAGIVKFKRRKNAISEKAGRRADESDPRERYLTGAGKTAGSAGKTVRDSQGISEEKRRTEEIRYQYVPSGRGTFKRTESGMRRKNMSAASEEMEEANGRYEKMKAEYEAIEEEIDEH